MTESALKFFWSRTIPNLRTEHITVVKWLGKHRILLRDAAAGEPVGRTCSHTAMCQPRIKFPDFADLKAHIGQSRRPEYIWQMIPPDAVWDGKEAVAERSLSKISQTSVMKGMTAQRKLGANPALTVKYLACLSILRHICSLWQNQRQKEFQYKSYLHCYRES